MEFKAYATGVIVLLLLWVLYRLSNGSWNPLSIVEGADGKPSTSKLQWFLWTVVVIFSYVVIYAARVWSGDYSVISNIPQNLLIVMGFSITSMVAAKGITVSYLRSGQLTKVQNDPDNKGVSWTVKDDGGFPDLSKIQIMAWTVIGIFVYLIRVIEEIHTGSLLELPDIDPALMVLMGLGQGAYIGKKLVTTNVPRLNGVSPGQGAAGTSVVITGDSFGDAQNGSLLTIDGAPIYPGGLTWTENHITFTFPEKQPSGSNWNSGQLVQVGVIVAGQRSGNSLPFVVSPVTS